jgi:hypothetical protein
MINTILLLHYLLYMHPTIGLTYDVTTKNCFVFKSGSTIRSCNRVCHTAIPTDNEVQEIIAFFAEIPFTWVVDATDDAGIAMLEKNNLQHKASFPAMLLDLNDLAVHSFEDTIIKEIDQNDTVDVATWISIVARSFPVPESELLKVIQVFKERIPSALRLYIGYYQENAVTAAMMIQHQETVTLHWISTLPEYRNKGLGCAITHKALLDAKNVGCNRAVLMSSVLGKRIYESIGFREYATYIMYGN